MRSFYFIGIFILIGINVYSQQWAYSFNNNLTPSPSNGSPTFTDVLTNTHGYFTGINSNCNSTTGEPAQGAYSRQDFVQNSGWEISFDATLMQSMSFSVCLRAASLASTTSFLIAASNDGFTTSVSTTVTFGSGTGASISGGSLTLPSSFDGSPSVEIQILRSSVGGATTVRIDNAILNGTALPIKLSNFSATIKDKSAIISWTTASESNNHYFTIERSADGSNFTSIGMVDGAGNSSSSIDYRYIDDAPLAGTSYYRLKQTDYDGQFTYSDVRAIQFSAGKKINFAYDAQGEEIRIQSSISDLSVRIFDMAGRVLKTVPTASSLTQVSVSDLQAGTYAAIVAGSSGVSETFKFVR